MSQHRSTVTDTDWKIANIELLGENFIVQFNNDIRMVIPMYCVSNSLLMAMQKEVRGYPLSTPTLGPEGGFKLSIGLGTAILRYVTTGRTI